MIKNEPRYWKEVDIAKIEEAYKAKYVFESPIKPHGGGWFDAPSLIFYCEEAHPRGSNYFALYHRDGNWLISDGITAICEEDGITAIRATNGDIIYSHWRHDFNTSTDGSVSIDGGRDYTRIMADNFEGRRVTLRVKDGVLVESKDDSTSES